MKVLTKILAAFVLLLGMASCGNNAIDSVKEANAAIDQKDYVAATKSLIKVTADDVKSFDVDGLIEYYKAYKRLDDTYYYMDSEDPQEITIGAILEEKVNDKEDNKDIVRNAYEVARDKVEELTGEDKAKFEIAYNALEKELDKIYATYHPDDDSDEESDDDE